MYRGECTKNEDDGMDPEDALQRQSWSIIAASSASVFLEFSLQVQDEEKTVLTSSKAKVTFSSNASRLNANVPLKA